MKKKRVVILGGGISGLTAAYVLKDKCDVILLEKSSSCGGAMRAVEKEGFFFECGPRTFRTKSSPHLLAMTEKLGLQGQLIASSPLAKKRYIFSQKALHELPSSPLGFFTSPLCKGLRKDVLFEWRRPVYEHEESIFDFASRRFGEVAANRFFDPFSLGIFGCDARRISIQSALPHLKEWERTYGSVTAGLLRALFRKRKSSSWIKAPLFSFRQGTPMLVQALQKPMEGVIRMEEETLSLHKHEKIVVKTSKGQYVADAVISALPPQSLGRLIHDLAPDAAVHLQAIPMTTLTVVHLGYRGDVLSRQGFGYLVPTTEQETVMGVIFDSAIFPEHNRGVQTRLTVMLRGNQENAIAIACEALERHLGLSKAPDVTHVEKQSLPIMELGHAEKIMAIQHELSRLLPQLHLIGNYLGNPSVEQCLARAMMSREADVYRT